METKHAGGGLVLCVTGAECTGKTTLARQLAEAFDAPLVAEAARRYLSGRPGYQADDVLAIARQQLESEQAALSGGASVVVADTDLTVIQVWWEERFGELDPWIKSALHQRTDRRYLLTCPDLPWEPDPLRESPLDRHRLHARYLQILRASRFPYVEVSGTGGDRLSRALTQARRWAG